MKGIVLIAVGSRGYGFMAHNLALSIKKHTKLPVSLLCSSESISDLTNLDLFDELIMLKSADYTHQGRFSPAKIKTHIYKHLPYTHNLYLDVDGILVKDIEPLMNELISDGRYYITDVQGKGGHGDEIPYSIWAENKDIIDFFSIPKKNDIVAIQSSWAYIRKNKKSEAFFAQVEKSFEKGFPLEKLVNKWGAGLPDELLFSGIISKKGLDVSWPTHPVYFGNRGNTKEVNEVVNDHYVLSIYGNGTGTTLTSLRYWEFYDRLNAKNSREFKVPFFKSLYIKPYKHANKR